MALDSSALPPAGGRIQTLEAERRRSRSSLRKFLYENSLVLVAFGLFLASWIGQFATGLVTYNDDQRAHGQPTVSAVEYLGEGHFIEVTFENWESEFLQMALFVVLTAALRQKGSPESKGLDGPEPVDADPRHAERRRDLPWPVRHGGLPLKLYEHSLSLALFLLFAASFALHAVGGAKEYNQEQLEHGEPAVSTLGYMGTPRFWFESFQNWQSEFLAVGVLVLLTVYLREKGSAQSKPVATPHWDQGEE